MYFLQRSIFHSIFTGHYGPFTRMVDIFKHTSWGSARSEIIDLSSVSISMVKYTHYQVSCRDVTMGIRFFSPIRFSYHDFNSVCMSLRSVIEMFLTGSPLKYHFHMSCVFVGGFPCPTTNFSCSNLSDLNQRFHTQNWLDRHIQFSRKKRWNFATKLILQYLWYLDSLRFGKDSKYCVFPYRDIYLPFSLCSVDPALIKLSFDLLKRKKTAIVLWDKSEMFTVSVRIQVSYMIIFTTWNVCMFLTLA